MDNLDISATTGPDTNVTLSPRDLAIISGRAFEIIDRDTDDHGYTFEPYLRMAYLLGGVPMLCIWRRWDGNGETISDGWCVGGLEGSGYAPISRAPCMPPQVASVLASIPGAVHMRVGERHTGGTAGMVPLLPLLRAWNRPEFRALETAISEAAEKERLHWEAQERDRDMLDARARERGFASHLESLRAPRVSRTPGDPHGTRLGGTQAAWVLADLRAGMEDRLYFP